ncbi:MAG: hypothetical protein AMXMBFR72_11840 [Betaproteobacteria bacterium]
MSAVVEFTPGSLVAARGREWIVLPGSTAQRLHLRPLGGSDEDSVVLAPALERTPVAPATFDWPRAEQASNHDASRLLRDALQLKLRAGAGPFRSFGHIAVEPRAYQLVPLLMALRQTTVRLLIADDVGIGKTIEAALIARELLDRGEIERMAVLCPPHLVDQWQRELEHRFHLRAVALTAASAPRLERDLPAGVKLFEQHPLVIVSLDYIKSPRHRDHFLAIAPEFVVVDEAHTCTTTGAGRHQRYELLRALAAKADRHLLLLTATPHSGDDAAFANMLGLLRPEFAQLANAAEAQLRALRERLAEHLVQRRRLDIDEWRESRLFPVRKITERTYKLTGAWGQFFDEVLDYCIDLAQRAEAASGERQGMMWYATLALLRCVASSPAAAASALRTRLEGRLAAEEIEDEASERVFDGSGAELATSDLEPAAALEQAAALRALIDRAERLAGQRGDPKLAKLTEHVAELLRDKFRPVVFCRFIATANYVAAELAKQFPKATVEAVTGELTPEEREERVALLAGAEQPILVATDCLSEGINLQDGFDAVVHYDLSWNPTRHEQREGRVDRFGQRREEVRCAMLYGEDNPVDGLILRVILRKAASIKDRLGVVVPMPDDDAKLTQAVLKASLLRRKAARRGRTLDLFTDDPAPELAAVEAAWEDAAKRAQSRRGTVFAQKRLKPDEVLPEWRRQMAVLGTEDDVERFVRDACARLGAPLESWRDVYRFVPAHLPAALKERLAADGLARELRIDFRSPPRHDAVFIHRTHPLAGALADYLVEQALDGADARVARCGVARTRDVGVVTTIALLRLRHQLRLVQETGERVLMAEETAAIAFTGRTNPPLVAGDDALRLLSAVPSSNVPDAKRTEEVNAALRLLAEQQAVLQRLAEERAQALLEDHRRVRDASHARGRYDVRPCLPVDVMGVYVLLPESL